jgi:hypothetical protein
MKEHYIGRAHSTHGAGEKCIVYILVGKPEEIRPLRGSIRWKDNIKVDLIETDGRL